MMLQQRRFAGSVTADHAYPLARLDQQARIVEQRQMAIGHPDVVERHERHGLGVRADGVEEHPAEIVGLSGADAFDRQKRVNRGRTKPCHLAQRRVVEYDVGRNAARPRDLQPDRSQPLEQIAIDVLPRFRLDTRLRARRAFPRRTLPSERESRDA